MCIWMPVLLPFKWQINPLVEADIWKIMGCVETNTLSVVTSCKQAKHLFAFFGGAAKGLMI